MGVISVCALYLHRKFPTLCVYGILWYVFMKEPFGDGCPMLLRSASGFQLGFTCYPYQYNSTHSPALWVRLLCSLFSGEEPCLGCSCLMAGFWALSLSYSSLPFSSRVPAHSSIKFSRWTADCDSFSEVVLLEVSGFHLIGIPFRLHSALVFPECVGWLLGRATWDMGVGVIPADFGLIVQLSFHSWFPPIVGTVLCPISFPLLVIHLTTTLTISEFGADPPLQHCAWISWSASVTNVDSGALPSTVP